MEPYDLKVHQLTFNEDQIQEGSLDSFSNVIHYDSALIDQKTGKKANTQKVSNSSQFAWSTSQNKALVSQAHILSAYPENHPTNQNPAISISTNHKSAPRSQDHFLPTPFQSVPIKPSYHRTGSTEDSETKVTKGEFAQQIDKLIKDVYSEVEVPFTPFTDKKTIPDWIFLHQPQNQDSRTFGRQPHHFIAQPSKVKVTHVYNQSVWSHVPSTAAEDHPKATTQVTSNTKQGLNNQPLLVNQGLSETVAQKVIQQTRLTGGTNITTLQQVAANTTAARHYYPQSHTKVPVYKMAANNENVDVKSAEPFESVAEALHLQQSVIGNRANVTPVSADVVAQIVAEAQRKIQQGNTPTQTGDAPTQTAVPTPTTDFALPPAPQLPDTATTRELIRIYGMDISRSNQAISQTANISRPIPQSVPPPQNPNQNGVQSSGSSTPRNTSVQNLFQQQLSNSDLPVDDNLSVASSNSELETLSENVTEIFLKSLPPFRPVNLTDIMPEPVHIPDSMRFSPPVKETSFRPVNNISDTSTSSSQIQGNNYQSFVTDSGVFSPETESINSPTLSSPLRTKSSYVIPKPGPLFQSTPRRNLISSLQQPSLSVASLSLDNSVQYDEVRKEKAKLEGQLEMLTIEAQATLQERAELQAQVASLKLKLMGQKAHKIDTEKDMLKADLDGLKQLRVSLETSLSDLQRQLEEKSEEGRNLQEELNQSQDQCDHLNLRMKEIRDDIKTKEMTIQALKNKVAELYVEVQSSMHIKLEADNETRSARSELLSLQSTKDWYQQQLEMATKARSELQKDLTLLQAQASSQSSIIERLKMENAKLRQHFSDIQNKALKEKEVLAKHLEAIESDMMDREAAFQEIQRERSFLEDAFSTKIQTAEDEKNRISLLMQMTNDLENQLDKAHNDLKKKQNQIVQLENENIELMKKLSLSQEAVIEKDNVIEDLKHSLIELEARLKAFQNSIVDKDEEIMKLKEDKAKTEIALNAALQEKDSVDQVLDGLKLDMGKVESSFKLMRQELNTKSVEVSQVKTGSKLTEEQIENLKRDLENERRNYELVKSEFENKSEQFNDLQGQKINLESEVLILREKLSTMEISHEEAVKEKQFLDSELNATREKLEDVKGKIESEKEIELEMKQKSSAMMVNDEEYKKIQNECVQLKEKVTKVEKDGKKDLMKQKARAAKLNQDLNAVKTELMERQKTYDENIEVLSGKLREVASEKEKMEMELSMTHRKYELSMLEQKDQIGNELQNLACELKQVKLEKQSLEAVYVELQHARDSDLHTFEQQLSALEEELRQSQETQRESSVTMETNQELALELEKEKGRLAGLMQSNATLKQHVGQLEEALAARESTLVRMQSEWQEAAHAHEQEAHVNIKRIQTLEEGLQKEKDGQREIRKQIGQKITENKKMKRQNDSLKQDNQSVRQDLAQRVQEGGLLQAELDTNKQEVLSRQAEMTSLESENKSVQRQLERLQQQLQDNIAREPVIQEQIKSLQWQLELKSKELQAAQDQLKLSEERQVAEMNSLRHVLQEKTNEVDVLKLDIASMKHDKQNQQAKISELRSALKSSIQHHKLMQKMSRLNTISGTGDAANLELPPLPFDMDDMDKLLQETTVRALESKPLDNLQNCLLNLRSEISGLQAQMDVHHNTLESSTNSWNSIEQQVQELCTVVQTITNTTVQSSTTNSLAAAAVQMADNVFDV